MHRRSFLARSTAAASLGALTQARSPLAAAEPAASTRANRIGVSTYSFWHFGKNPHDVRDVEKPVSHNLTEGRRMVEAARKYDRVVQAGTQRRSGAFCQSAAEFVRTGKLGKVPFARTWIAGHRPSIGHK